MKSWDDKVFKRTSPRGQQSRASGNNKQKSLNMGAHEKMLKDVKNVKNVLPPLQGCAMSTCIDTKSIQ